MISTLSMPTDFIAKLIRACEFSCTCLVWLNNVFEHQNFDFQIIATKLQILIILLSFFLFFAITCKKTSPNNTVWWARAAADAKKNEHYRLNSISVAQKFVIFFFMFWYKYRWEWHRNKKKVKHLRQSAWNRCMTQPWAISCAGWKYKNIPKKIQIKSEIGIVVWCLMRTSFVAL